MKITYISDLHINFLPAIIENFLWYTTEQTNVLVIAGDVHESKKVAKRLRDICNSCSPLPVFYVVGNHDMWGRELKYTLNSLEKLEEELDNFIFLNKNIVEVDDVVFMGAYGWQMHEDYNAYNYFNMNDFRYIPHLREIDIPKWGKIQYNFFKNTLKKYHDKKVVGITHIPPIKNCISDRKSLPKAYYNLYDDLFDFDNLKLWICGHVHESFDFTFKDTRLVCNPHGYKMPNDKSEYNHEFFTHKMVEI